MLFVFHVAVSMLDHYPGGGTAIGWCDRVQDSRLGFKLGFRIQGQGSRLGFKVRVKRAPITRLSTCPNPQIEQIPSKLVLISHTHIPIFLGEHLFSISSLWRGR